MAEWYEDWSVKLQLRKANKHENSALPRGAHVIINLPNSRNGNTQWKHYFNAGEYKDASELMGILLSAFEQIQRDHGGYK